MGRKKNRNQRKLQETKIPGISSPRLDVVPPSPIPDTNNQFFPFRSDIDNEEDMAEETKKDITGTEPKEHEPPHEAAYPNTREAPWYSSSAPKMTSPIERKGVPSGKPDGNKIKYTLDKDLENLLRSIFAIRPDDSNHELIQALSYDSIHAWRTFIRLQPEAIENLTKKIDRGRAPIGKSIIMELKILLSFIRDKIDNKEPHAKDIDTYDVDEFEEYLDAQYLARKNAAISGITNIRSPPTGSGYNSRPRTEKMLDNWDKKKLDKTNYEILRSDSQYKVWKETFVAEIKVQGLTRMIDPNFNKGNLMDQYDRELYEKQSNYLWTVLLYALRNPVSEAILGKHRDVSDARIAFVAVDDKMKGKVAQLYNVSDLSDTLRDLHISTFTGNRVEFIALWFEKLRQLNKLADKDDKLSFIHVRSQLMRAINTDRDLTNSFTELKDEPDKDLAIPRLMDHLLNKAMLYDGRDNSSESTSKDRKHLNALLHKMGLEEEYEVIVNKTRRNGPSEDCKLPDDIYSMLSREDKSKWREFSDDARRTICFKLRNHSNTKSPTARTAYAHHQDMSSIPYGETLPETLSVLRHSLHQAEERIRSLETQHEIDDAKSQALTVMSSISSKSRQPATSKMKESMGSLQPAKRPEKPGMGHPGSIMASKTEQLEEDDQQKKNISFYGYQALKHSMLYTHHEKQLDNACSSDIDTIIYNVTKRDIKNKPSMSLADRGANGCVAGDDCNWMGGPDIKRRVHITGMDNHQVRDIIIGTVGAYVISNRGPVICVFHETAYTGRGQSILSSLQMEHFKNLVDDRVIGLGGGQQITTADGYNFPLSIVNGLPYLQMRRFTKNEYLTLPHVNMTSEQPWDPRLYDNYIDPKSNQYKQANPANMHLLPYDEYNVKGEYIGVHATRINDNHRPFKFWLHELDYYHKETVYRCAHAAVTRNRGLTDTEIIQAYNTEISANSMPRTHIPSDVDYEHMKPYFAWIPSNLIKKTFENSTQYGYMPTSPDGNLFKRWKSPNPAMNIFRLQDDLLTDKIHSNTPALEGGFKDAQIFFGRKSHIIHVESISKTKSFLRCIQNFVTKWGAPARMLADHISYHSSFQVLDYLRMLWIQLWFSEAYYQHQNPFERRYQTFKRIVNRTMDRTSTPPELWFLCMSYIAYVLNRVSDPTLNHRQPIMVATGSIGDISAITTFQWLEPLYYRNDTRQITFPDTGEGFGHFVGIAENVGHTMTYKIWTKQTGRVIERSSVRSAWDDRFPNHRAQITPTETVSQQRGYKHKIGNRIAKSFDDTIHFGTIREYWIHKQEPTWHIKYDDGDAEDFDSQQLENATRLYAEHNLKDVNTLRASNHKNNGEIPKFYKPTDFIYSRNDSNSNSSRPGVVITPDSSEYGEQNYLGDNGSENIEVDTHVINQNKGGAQMVILVDDDGNPKVDSYGNAILIPGKTADELQGITFKLRQDDGEVLRARVLRPIENNTINKKGRQALDRFHIKYDRTQVEDTMTYNDIMNYIHRDNTESNGVVWNFRRIMSHRPVSHRDPLYKNSGINLAIEWENGEITEEPLKWMIKEDPFVVAKYAREHGLLEEEGWKSLKRHAARDKLLERVIKQAKLRSFRTSPKYMYGFRVPRDYKEALEFDDQNGNNMWADATVLEMNQLHAYEVFIDEGLFSEVPMPPGFKKIRVHLVFAVKHDGRHKARLVADGHLTDMPLNSVYAGVVSIRGLRMCIFLAELNGMEAYATDVGNAYLEAITQEKVCIKAGPEFGDLEGHLLIVYKALYGLRSSGKQFGDLLATCLRELGFIPSRAEPQIFMRRNGDLYEYIATYVDDLCLVMKDPKGFLELLQGEPYSFKLKGSGPMAFHLGCGFERDKMGTLCMDPIKYIEKMMQGYKQLFGKLPSTKPRSPLEDGDHPELDTTEFLDEDDTQKYQSLIGSLQWLITLGRWDIQTSVMTLSSFRAKPRKGHLLRAKRVYGYIRRFKHYKIRFRTGEPDLSNLDCNTEMDWSRDVYEEQSEQLPTDSPPPLGKKVTFIHWFDANLMHDVISGKAVTGCIHYVNKTPIMWHSKKQATTETATYGAEFCAGRTCIEQVVDLRNTFRYLGVPIHNISYVFGDNKSMIDSSTYPDARIHKRHNILSFHYVRSMIARGFIALTHINSENNLADVVTKHWSYNTVKGLLKPVFDHMGNTDELYAE